MIVKKKSIAIIAFGIIFLIFAIIQGIRFFLTFFHFEKLINRPSLLWLPFFDLIKTIIFFLIGIGILKLKQFARKVLLSLFYLYIFISIVYIAGDWYESSFSTVIKKDFRYFLLILFAFLGIITFTRKSTKDYFDKRRTDIT